MNTNTTPRSRPTHHAVRPFTPRRGGIAMMLVIVAVAVGTILAAAALTSNTNAPALAENARHSVQSYWQAEAAANYTEKLIEKITSVADASMPTMPAPITTPGGAVSVKVTDIDGNAPDNTDRELLITVVSSVGGIEHTTRRRVSVAPPGTLEDAIDPELKEFAVFATDSLSIGDSAKLGPWPISPEIRTQEPIKIGGGFTALSDMSMSADASAQRVAFYPAAGASAALETMTSDGRFVRGGWKMNLAIPAIDAASPSDFSSLTNFNTAQTASGPSASIVPPPGKYRDLNCNLGGVAKLGDGATLHHYCFKSIILDSQAILAIHGPVEIMVTDNISITNKATIELADPTASLVIYCKKMVAVDDACIGVDDTIAVQSNRKPAMVSYTDPSRIKITTLTGSMPEFLFDNNSIVVASIHSPGGPFEMQNGSTLFGRVTCSDMTLGTNCNLFYDPAMDNRLGFTASKGPMYKPDGTPITGLADALASFNKNLGMQSLKTYVTGAVSTVSATSQTAGELLGGGRAGASGTSGGTSGSGLSSTSLRRVSSTPVGVAAARSEKRQAPDMADLVDAEP
jgi:hypothetical protein